MRVHGVARATSFDGSCEAGGHANSGRVNRRSPVSQGLTFVNPNKIAFPQKINLAPFVRAGGHPADDNTRPHVLNWAIN